jgi:integrase
MEDPPHPSMPPPLVRAPQTFADALARDGELVELVEYAQALADESQAPSTRRSYLTAFTAFSVWCRETGLSPLPAEPATLGVYLGVLERRGRLVATIERTLAAIADAHRRHNLDAPHPSPITIKIMKGLRRRLSIAPRTQKDALSDADLIAMMRLLGDDLAGRRDRVLLTWGFTGAFRRAELVAVRVEDLRRSPAGIVVTVRKSKTDQEGHGEVKIITPASVADVCPLRAYDAWLALSGITRGPLFRGLLNGKLKPRALCAASVADIVKSAGQRAGLDPARIAAHSLRAGFVTTAHAKGCSMDAIMKQTNHKSERTARGYVRHQEAFTKNAAVGLL